MLAFLVLLLAGIVMAQDDFSATSNNAVIELCKGSTFIDSISIFNSNDVSAYFTVYPTGEASTWNTITPSSFMLEPYQSQLIQNFITPSVDAEGEYELQVEITANGRITKLLKQTVIIACDSADGVKYPLEALKIREFTIEHTGQTVAWIGI